MKFGLKLALYGSVLASTMMLTAGPRAQAPAAEGAVTEDWLQVSGSKSKVFLPGQWAYETSTSPEGTQVTAHGGAGKLQLTVQTIEGKTEATPEKLRDVFEQHIVPGSQHTDEKAETGVRRRYTATVNGQEAVFKALFVRNADVSYMVYIQALAADVAADANLEKTMDSVLGSFQPM